MNILITNTSLNTLGGSENWCLTMAKSLIGLGHNVFALSNNYGRMYKLMESVGVRKDCMAEYDLILANHPQNIPGFKDKKGVKIQTVHSKYVSIERPIDFVDAHIAISGEIADYFSISDIIYNPVNLVDYTKNESAEPYILCLCQNNVAATNVKKYAKRMNIKFVHHSKWHNPISQEQLYKSMVDAEFVVGVGRGVYEAVSHGAKCVVYDTRDYDKNNLPYPLTREDFEKSLYGNFTGRAKVGKMTLDAAFVKSEFIKDDKFSGANIATQYLTKYIRICQDQD